MALTAQAEAIELAPEPQAHVRLFLDEGEPRLGLLRLANTGATALAGATVTMAGVMFCALYALTGRLWVPIGVHAAWNLAQGYLFGAAVSGGNLGGSIPSAPPAQGHRPG